jgi:hypothetical protein
MEEKRKEKKRKKKESPFLMVVFRFEDGKLRRTPLRAVWYAILEGPMFPM